MPFRSPAEFNRVSSVFALGVFAVVVILFTALYAWDPWLEPGATVDDVQEPAPGASPRLTRSGAIVGTPAYLPPEASGGSQALGPSADIYSFGLLACELLTGARPSDAATARQLLQGLDAPSVETLSRCLSREPGQRPSAVAVHAALGAAQYAPLLQASRLSSL